MGKEPVMLHQMRHKMNQAFDFNHQPPRSLPHRFPHNLPARFLHRLQGLSDVIWRRILGRSGLGAGLLFLVSQISIPLRPVPITLQTVGVIFIGLKFDRRAAILSVLAYLGVGALGLPLFCEFSGGPLVLLGPTGGYLIGFLPAVIAMTWMRERIKVASPLPLFLSGLGGTAIIFLLGVGWLSTFLGIEKAVVLGALPFLIPGLLKALLLAVMIGYVEAPRDEPI